MDEVQVEVFQPEVLQLLARNRLDLVALVERVPQLGHHEELLALDEAVLDGACNALADLLFVAVV